MLMLRLASRNVDRNDEVLLIAPSGHGSYVHSQQRVRRECSGAAGCVVYRQAELCSQEPVDIRNSSTRLQLIMGEMNHRRAVETFLPITLMLLQPRRVSPMLLQGIVAVLRHRGLRHSDARVFSP